MSATTRALLTTFLACLPMSLQAAVADKVDLPRYPAISPDGAWTTFSWRGDIWLVPTEGGEATRLTSHPGVDSRSAWSPDGSLIAFESDRDGYRNIWTVRPDGGGIKQVVQTDRFAILNDFGPASGGDGHSIMFDSRIEGDFYRANRPYEVDPEGGPFKRVHDAFGTAATRSPDGERVLFERGGSSWTRRHYRGPDARDVWLHDPEVGFVQLTMWEGNDGEPAWIDDDTMIFMSDRELDTVNLYRRPVEPGSGRPTRLTDFDDHDITAFDISRDGRTAIFQNWDTLYSLDLTDDRATPRPLAITANVDGMERVIPRNVSRNVTEAALSPDGKVMAVVAYGDVWVRNIEDKSPTRRVTTTLAHDKEIAWSPDGLKLYFTSDEDGTDSIHAATVARTREELRDAWKEATEPVSDESEESEETEEAEEVEETDAATEDAPEDDGKEDPAEEPGDAPGPKPLPGAETKDEPGDEDADEEEDPKAGEEEEEEADPAFDPDRWHDAIEFDIEEVVHTEFNDSQPVPSPDGMKLAFRRGLGDLIVLDIESGEESVIREGWDGWSQYTWAPDSTALAMSIDDRNFNSDIWYVPIDDPEARVNISRHPDNDTDPSFSADGRILAFTSERKDEEFDVQVVYLDKSLEGLLEPELESYYEEAVKKVKKRKPIPVRKPGDKPKKKPERDWEMSLDDAYLRLSRMSSLPGNERSVRITPGGDKIIYSHSGGGPGDAGIWTVKWDGSGDKRIGSGSIQHLNLTGDKIVTVSGGAGILPVAGGSSKSVPIDAEIELDLAEQSSRKFQEAARIFGMLFYHPEMKGLDWEELTDNYHELASRAWTGDEFNWVAARMLGELNASHTGIRSPGYSSNVSRSQGRLGTIHRPVEGGFEVVDVIEGSPAATGPMPILVGDVITSVDSRPVGPRDRLGTMLRGRIGEEVMIGLQRKVDGDEADGPGETIDLIALIEPISSGAQNGLLYDRHQTRAQELVDELSDGRVGYLHVQSMNQSSLDEFERDLYAVAEGRDALIVDVRNNGGGWTADRLLTSLSARPHAYTVPRGADPEMKSGYPQDRLFIQRYVLPVNMLCNEKSFSNAEIVSHAFKTLDRGTLVGQQTYGGVISTGGTSLVDGTSIRLPFRGWYLLDGTDMENNGAMPDIVVHQLPQDEAEGFDAQLHAAIEDLLQRIPESEEEQGR